MSRRTRRTLSLGATISTLTMGLMTATASPSAHAAGPAHAFPSHQTYKVGVMPSASQAVRDAAVQKQYDSWKATYLVHGCATNESPESVALSASGLPSGATASFSPASVTAGGSSTLTITTSASTPSGTYPVTVTATAPSVTHTATFSLVVTGPSGGGPIVNGGFESGTLSGWTVSGSASAVSSPVHSGGFAALVGATGETNGLSKASQHFTAPPGGGTLSLWYDVSCTDRSGGYATVLLVDTTSSSTTRVLNRVCTTGQGWKNASAPLTAGHSYTLELESRDDGVSGTPGSAAYDDITVS